MLAPFKKSHHRLYAAERVKRWTRQRFSLGDGETMLVSEVESAVPGFPPLVTVVAFWTSEHKHYHFQVFKPLQEVTEDDVPPSWFRDALAVSAGIDCGCC